VVRHLTGKEILSVRFLSLSEVSLSSETSSEAMDALQYRMSSVESAGFKFNSEDPVGNSLSMVPWTQWTGECVYECILR